MKNITLLIWKANDDLINAKYDYIQIISIEQKVLMMKRFLRELPGRCLD
jgi:hypothetical protein